MFWLSAFTAHKQCNEEVMHVEQYFDRCPKAACVPRVHCDMYSCKCTPQDSPSRSCILVVLPSLLAALVCLCLRACLVLTYFLRTQSSPTANRLNTPSSRMPTVDIVTIPVEPGTDVLNPDSAEAQAFAQGMQILERQEGFREAWYGHRIEDATKLMLLLSNRSLPVCVDLVPC